MSQDKKMGFCIFYASGKKPFGNFIITSIGSLISWPERKEVVKVAKKNFPSDPVSLTFTTLPSRKVRNVAIFLFAHCCLSGSCGLPKLDLFTLFWAEI